MGRLIDETDLKNLLYVLDDARYDLYYAIKKIPELPTVDAIPKDQYETRLKADLVAMLEELKAEFEVMPCHAHRTKNGSVAVLSKGEIEDAIQQKIDKLKGEQE